MVGIDNGIVRPTGWHWINATMKMISDSLVHLFQSTTKVRPTILFHSQTLLVHLSISPLCLYQICPVNLANELFPNWNSTMFDQIDNICIRIKFRMRMRVSNWFYSVQFHTTLTLYQRSVCMNRNTCWVNETNLRLYLSLSKPFSPISEYSESHWWVIYLIIESLFH